MLFCVPSPLNCAGTVLYQLDHDPKQGGSLGTYSQFSYGIFEFSLFYAEWISQQESISHDVSDEKCQRELGVHTDFKGMIFAGKSCSPEAEYIRHLFLQPTYVLTFLILFLW